VFEVAEHPEGAMAKIRRELLENTDELKWWLAIDSVLVALYNLRSYVETGTPRLLFDLSDSGTDVLCDIAIEAPKQDVWTALTVPTEMDKWVSSGAKVALHVGGEYTYGWGDGPHKILELAEGQKLVTDWTYADEPETQVKWAIEEGASGGATVTVTHSGFASADQTKSVIQGWNAFFGELVALLEGRRLASPVPIQGRPDQ
jgi:uncharacterized protein YndB with AHSA1/START domain